MKSGTIVMHYKKKLAGGSETVSEFYYIIEIG